MRREPSDMRDPCPIPASLLPYLPLPMRLHRANTWFWLGFYGHWHLDGAASRRRARIARPFARHAVNGRPET